MKKMRLILLLFVLQICTLTAIAQNNQAAVLTLAGEQTTLEEFENIFRKNNRDSVVTRQSLDDYMELFINFKLKVREARDLKMDTVSKFKNELDGYRTQLARPYMTDAEMLNDLVKEAYARQCQEIRAKHILIKCEPNASPEDTLRAYNRILALRDRILSGADFATVARGKDGSEDPTAKDNGGDLGYFTAFQMVYQFEDAAYNTPVGKVSMPVRTRYGYHIIQVDDKRPARGEVHVAHIMVKAGTDADSEKNAETKINEIYQKAITGESTFEELASKFSDDGSSAKKGGELPWFGAGKMVLEFEDAAFSLKNDGDICKPFKTSFGWHIIKRLGYKPTPSFEEMEKEIKGKVSKDGRSEKTKASFVQKLKKEYNYTFNDAALKPLLAKVDTTVFEGKIKAKKSALKKTLVTIDGKQYKVSDFAEWMKKRGGMRTKQTPQEYLKAQAIKYGEDQLVAYEDGKLEQKHTAFRLLMKEYREGILLFELTDQKVWSKAVKDTTGLHQYYEQNKSKYMWPERAEVTIYTCSDAAVASNVRAMIAKGLDKSAIASELNKDSQLNLQIEEGTFAKDDRELMSMIPWSKGLSSNIPLDDQIVIVNVKSILPVSQKKLSEAKGLITSDYQNYLEAEWIKDLRAKYKYEVNRDVLYSIR